MAAIYLAARFDQRTSLLQTVVPALTAMGHVITSSWIHTSENEDVVSATLRALSPDADTDDGKACLADIDRADVVVVFTNQPSSTGGYHVEFGYATARGKRIEIVGPALNIFHAGTTRHPSIPAFLQAWRCSS